MVLCPTELGAYARQKFINVKGLDHVIICTAVKAKHAIFDCVASRQHEDGDVAFLADALTDFDAINAR